METYGGADVYIHVFLISALVGGEWSASRPGRFTTRKKAPGTHCVRGWVGHRIWLDDVEKEKILPPWGLEIRPLGHPARSRSLYQLRNPDFGSLVAVHVFYCLPTWRHVFQTSWNKPLIEEHFWKLVVYRRSHYRIAANDSWTLN
jgi:hypothetical protein